MSNEEENVDVEGLSDSEFEEEENWNDDGRGFDLDGALADNESDEEDMNEDDEDSEQDGASGGAKPKLTKDHHNSLERRRRNELSSSFKTLREHLKSIGEDFPSSDEKMSRDMILHVAKRKLLEFHKRMVTAEDDLKTLNQIKAEVDQCHAEQSGSCSSSGPSSSKRRKKAE